MDELIKIMRIEKKGQPRAPKGDAKVKTKKPKIEKGLKTVPIETETKVIIEKPKRVKKSEVVIEKPKRIKKRKITHIEKKRIKVMNEQNIVMGQLAPFRRIVIVRLSYVNCTIDVRRLYGDRTSILR